MEDFKKNAAETDKEIVFSKTIKAGKRIYYLDVKKNRKGEMFLAITESKKIVSGESESPQVSFEKHKIFLYKEDFDKFMKGLNQTINYIEQEQGKATVTEPPATREKADSSSPRDENENTEKQDEIKIDIDF